MYIENIDLGTIKINKKHSFLGLIRNNSEFPITIIRVQVSCSSCTDANARKKEILPGEEVLMDISYTPFSLGVHDKSITVHYIENNVVLEYRFVFKAIII